MPDQSGAILNPELLMVAGEMRTKKRTDLQRRIRAAGWKAAGISGLGWLAALAAWILLTEFSRVSAAAILAILVAVPALSGYLYRRCRRRQMRSLLLSLPLEERQAVLLPLREEDPHDRYRMVHALIDDVMRPNREREVVPANPADGSGSEAAAADAPMGEQAEM